MYDPQYTKTFYDTYGFAEWSRLENTAYGRLQAIIHTDYIRRYIKPGDRVLDAGSGPGRFSIEIARLGAQITVLDISKKQLSLAKQKLTKAHVLDQVEQFIEADIVDLSVFEDKYFDIVVCFGGALSYVCEKRRQAAAELQRVTKKRGTLLISVMSRMGTIVGVSRQADLPILKEPDKDEYGKPGLWHILKTGNIPGFYSRTAKMLHAPMHLFTGKELTNLFKECKLLEIAGSNVTIGERANSGETIATDGRAWSTLIDLERRLNTDPGLINVGSHLILVARR
jgi:ubiquinone/menaquinone biosynthesis C-methylase UbiE